MLLDSTLKKRGRLYVFEGPDGVGKSTLANAVFARLQHAGVQCQLLSFPGREPGTLGSHVYRLHHNLGDFGIETIDASSMQVLHIAAHIDAIENRIHPMLLAGSTIILDRFWWSTWVYGVESGVSEESLQRMIDLEKVHWKSSEPDIVFLVQRSSPFRAEHSERRFSRLNALYLELAARAQQNVCVIRNEGTLDQVASSIVENALATRGRGIWAGQGDDLE